MSSLRDALEAALVENPDDLAAHMAYADHLHEQGDPRGELIQTQLALENETLKEAERKRLRAREEVLLNETRDACVGAKFAALLRREPYLGPPQVRIERGWLAGVTSHGILDSEMAAALIDSPETRLLRELTVAYIPRPEYLPPGEVDTLALLAGSAHLPNLRKLYLGTTEGFQAIQDEPKVYNGRWELPVLGASLWDWLATLPRLEELYLEGLTQNTERLFGMPSLTNLRVLQLNLSDDYPLTTLAQNAALANLTTLSLHPLAAPMEAGGGPYLDAAGLHALATAPHLRNLTHLRYQKSDAGDAGLQSLRDSGMLARLRFLDLAMGTITDAGANLLATARLDRLEVLDVVLNALTPDGQRQLSTALGKKLTLRVNEQAAYPNPEWVFYGEME